MADVLVSAFLTVLFERLASRQVVNFFRKEKACQKLLTRLKTSLMTVNVVLDDAEAKEFTHPAVKQWLEELKDATYHAEDLLDEIVTLANKQKNSIFNKCKFGVKRVEPVVFKMELLASQKELLGLLHGRVGDRTSMQVGRRRTTTSLADSFVYGRDDDKQKIIGSVLLDVAVGDPIPVITIVGMGGIGKTTLAKMVYNDEKVSEYFDTKAWVCVSQELDVFQITKTVLETIIPRCSSGIVDLNLLQLKLKEMLAGKRILLVLDDVWNEDYDKWCMLRAPFTTVSSGSKVIVTTRNDGVASIMRTRTNPSHYLQHLSDENGWKLFADHAFETTDCDGFPILEVIGKQIVKKCKGLPLALKLLGGVLRNKDDERVWENVMKSEFWDLPIGKTSILPALRLSYHYLPTHLKPCFGYCSIFPQDFVFEKEKLVLLWMAEGFVTKKTDKCMEELGEEYFDELFSRSFFQKSSSGNGTFFVMHDLNNDLARDVSGKFCFALETSNAGRVSEKVRHLSCSRDTFKFEPILNAKYLRTFLPWKAHLSITIIRDLVPKLSCIRVLSLFSYTNVVELPDSICSLIHLRYLDLSQTTIQCLPNTICQLYNLQTLNLSDCYHLTKLPANMNELVNLRHFDITNTNVRKLPLQMRRLESLQTLSTFYVGKQNCSGLGELKEFQHLKGFLSIYGLRNVTNVEDAMEAKLKEKIGIQGLLFSWSSTKLFSKEVYFAKEVVESDIRVLDYLEPCVNLNHLTIDNYGGTRLSNWLGDGSLSNLTRLKISHCVHCLSLPSLGQLPSLVELHFDNMTSVRRVDSDFYGNTVKPFQKLSILKFESMPEWEEWSSSGGGDKIDFPKLETLDICSCPKLCGNIPKHLPSLGDLRIESYGELTAIIHGDASPRSLRLNGCKNVVFENTTNLNSLLSLEIGNLESNSFSIGMMENCNHLEVLKITYWSSLMHLPDEGLPMTLKKLEISYCSNLKDFLPKETFHNYKLLTSLSLRCGTCDSITSFPLGLFPNLVILSIFSLENLESFSIEDVDHENLESLRRLYIRGCDKLTDFPSGGLPTPNLNSLHISDCKNLKSLPEGMNTQLTSLQYLKISYCEQVESFPAGGLPSNLLSLCIMDCKKVMAKRRNWDLHTLSFLDALTIGSHPRGSKLSTNTAYCEEIVTFPEAGWQLPTSLNSLSIAKLSNLKTIDASKLPNLQAVHIFDCPKVKFDSELRNAQDLPPSFAKLSINKCPLMTKQLQTTNTDLIPHVRIDDGCFCIC